MFNTYLLHSEPPRPSLCRASRSARTCIHAIAATGRATDSPCPHP